MVIDSKPLPSKTKDGFMVIGLVFIPHVKIYPPKAEASLPNQPSTLDGVGRGSDGAKKVLFLKKVQRQKFHPDGSDLDGYFRLLDGYFRLSDGLVRVS